VTILKKYGSIFRSDCKEITNPWLTTTYKIAKIRVFGRRQSFAGKYAKYEKRFVGKIRMMSF